MNRHFSYLRHVLLGLFLSIMLTPAWAQARSEEQLKAAYLVNFLRYIEWPNNPPSVTVCLFGRDALANNVMSYEGRTVGGRELRVRRISNVEQMQECHALFIPENEENRLSVVFRTLNGYPVLTVSDIENFAQRGGAIGLVRAPSNLQFDVNADIMQRLGLRPNLQMLRLARQVVGSPR